MKKILLVCILLLQVCFFTACKENDKNIEEITIGDQFIFDCEEDHYLIYFYADKCQECKKTNQCVNQYYKNSKNEDKNLPLIYAVNIHPSGEKSSYIFREFEIGKTGQGTNNNFYVDGVKDWQELYISSVPALIEIKTEFSKNGEVKKAFFIADGEKNIRRYLTDLLG